MQDNQLLPSSAAVTSLSRWSMTQGFHNKLGFFNYLILSGVCVCVCSHVHVRPCVPAMAVGSELFILSQHQENHPKGMDDHPTVKLTSRTIKTKGICLGLGLPITFVKFTPASMKHHDPKQLGEERVCLAYASTPQFIIEGSQGRNSSRAGTWRQELMQRPWRGDAH